MVPTVAEVMKRPYPELADSVRRVQTVIREEEEQFVRTVDSGSKQLRDVFRKTKAGGSDVVSGKDLFNLLATHGIPVEMTESFAPGGKISGSTVPVSRRRWTSMRRSAGRNDSSAVFTAGPLDTLKKSFHQGSEFLGYENMRSESRVIGIVAQNQLTDLATRG